VTYLYHTLLTAYHVPYAVVSYPTIKNHPNEMKRRVFLILVSESDTPIPQKLRIFLSFPFLSFTLPAGGFQDEKSVNE
jgi:hypothetical protein